MNAILSDVFDIENINEDIASDFSGMILKTEAEIERKVEETAKTIFEKPFGASYEGAAFVRGGTLY